MELLFTFTISYFAMYIYAHIQVVGCWMSWSIEEQVTTGQNVGDPIK